MGYINAYRKQYGLNSITKFFDKLNFFVCVCHLKLKTSHLPKSLFCHYYITIDVVLLQYAVSMLTCNSMAHNCAKCMKPHVV